jgi:choline dehydrogenase
MTTPGKQGEGGGKVRAEVAVLGGGTAGAVVAGLLAEAGAEVLGVEAGPDYGAFAAGDWPPDLLDSRTLALSHDWGYDSGDSLPGRTLNFERARVVGGCSTHNGCSQTVGPREDYDGWGLPGLDADALAPELEDGARRLRVRDREPDELTPFQLAALEAMVADGIPRTDDLLDLDGGVGCGPSPVNDVDGVRWNAAFAYLDPVRDRISVLDRALVDRLDLDGGRCRGAEVIRDGARISVSADRFVLCGGAYGSPAVLLRSGVGEPQALGALGIDPALELAGVGRNLHDHPTLTLRFRASELLEREFAALRAAGHTLPDESIIAKLDSGVGPGPYDTHLLPWTEETPTGVECFLPVACVAPRSRGALTLLSADPERAPRIDHAYLSDPGGEDAEVLRRGVATWRRLVTSREFGPMLGEPLDALSAGTEDGPTLANVEHYWHPAGTCALGLDPAAGAVLDPGGRVHGLDNVWVIDASSMPAIPRATPNLPIVALAAALTRSLIAGATAG